MCCLCASLLLKKDSWASIYFIFGKLEFYFFPLTHSYGRSGAVSGTSSCASQVASHKNVDYFSLYFVSSAKRKRKKEKKKKIFGLLQS